MARGQDKLRCYISAKQARSPLAQMPFAQHLVKKKSKASDAINRIKHRDQRTAFKEQTIGSSKEDAQIQMLNETRQKPQSQEQGSSSDRRSDSKLSTQAASLRSQLLQSSLNRAHSDRSRSRRWTSAQLRSTSSARHSQRRGSPTRTSEHDLGH